MADISASRLFSLTVSSFYHWFFVLLELGSLRVRFPTYHMSASGSDLCCTRAGSPGWGDRKAKSSSAREPDEEHVATTSQEASLAPRKIILEYDVVIHIQESPPRLVATLNEAQAVEEKPIDMSRAIDEALNSFFEGVVFGMLEDYSGFGHREIPKRVVQLGLGEPSSSSKLEKQFSAPSVDPNRKKTVMFTVPADTSMLSKPVGVAIYLCSLVTEEDQVKMNESQASVLHYESFHRSRIEVSHLEFELKEQVQQKEMYKSLGEQKDEVLKHMVDRSILQDELEKAQKEASKVKQDHALLDEKVRVLEIYNESLNANVNAATLQVQEKITLIDQLRSEMDEVKASVDELRGKMDLLASDRDATKEDPTSTKVHLRVMRKKAYKWSRLNEELRAQLASAVVERDTLGQEYITLKSKLEVASNDVSEAQNMLAQYNNDVEVVEARIIIKAEYVKWLSRRETLEEARSRGQSELYTLLVAMASSFDVVVAYRNLKLGSPTSTGIKASAL
uniref:Uncharacterized protein n=1 Tax=Nicotiana tabacum TaxID=4097 RepID=A0A1S4BRH9_TOBAC|nr:PREDICTED: uncharacterized protein LOC107811132 [Nicotiana tabacum]